MSAASRKTSVTSNPPGAAASGAARSDVTGSSVNDKAFGPPVVLAPVSQISRSAPRKSSRTEAAVAAADKASKFDPDYYNPDGSLRTMHKMPHFEQSYAQAMQARYIRHSRPVEREQELSVQQIFDKK